MITRNGLPLNFSRANRVTSIGGVANYEYDGHGRRTTQWRSDGTVRVSLYTLDGRLQGEAYNRAVGSTDYMYLGSTLVARRFQHWSGSPPVVTYHHSDALGSPVAVSNAGGQLQSREWYTSYGAPADGATEDQIGYTGHQSDPVTGLVYAQQRYYDPAIGRFLSVDPVATDPNTGASFNRYTYANNNAYRFLDPDGRNSTCTASAQAAAMCASPETAAGTGETAKEAVTVIRVFRNLAALNEAAQSADDEPSPEEKATNEAIGKIRDGKAPAPGVAGERGELVGRDGGGDEDWGTLGATPGAEKNGENNIRLPDGSNANRHESTRPYPDGPAEGTDTIKVYPKGGSKPTTTIRYPKSK